MLNYDPTFASDGHDEVLRELEQCYSFSRKEEVKEVANETAPEEVKMFRRLRKVKEMSKKVANSVVNSKAGKKFIEHLPEEVVQASVVGYSIMQDAVGRGKKVLSERFKDRARTSFRGSAGDIGWLQKERDMPPVVDGTKRFTEILDNIRNNEHKLPNSLVYVLVPGLLSNHGSLYFVSTQKIFSKMGLACHIAKIHSEASVEKNARDIKEYIEEIYSGSRKRVMLLGHSKGGIDAAASLSLYWSDLKDKVAGLALAQSPYGGNPIASDFLRDGQLSEYVKGRKIVEILFCNGLKGDLKALEDLTYDKRKEFLRKHPLPADLPVVSFHTKTRSDTRAICSLSHIGQAELPLVPPKIPVVLPMAVVMAACSFLLKVRYGVKSDGVVTRPDAEVPGSVVVRLSKKFDHTWMVYSSNCGSDEANAPQMCEAILTLLVEHAQP